MSYIVTTDAVSVQKEPASKPFVLNGGELQLSAVATGVISSGGTGFSAIGAGSKPWNISMGCDDCPAPNTS